nr:reverse transcriptase domain-containing protein [Tanacetum cinerariifolium]
MSTHSGSSPTASTSVVRNTVGREKEMMQGNLNGLATDAALREYCDKHYNQLLPILAEKIHQEKVQQEKLKAVKARLNFEDVSQHSESGTPSRRRDLRKRLGSRRIHNVSGSPEPRRGRSESPRKRDPKRKTVFKRLKNCVFHRLGDKGKSISAYSNDSRRQSYHRSHRDTLSCYQSSRSRGTELSPEKHHNKRASSSRTEVLSESEGSAGGYWKSRSKKQRSSIEDDDIPQPWVCEETDPFTPRICYFDLSKRTRMPSHVKTYDESEDPADHLKIFQAAAKVERWSMPTWCHMFNSTLTGSARREGKSTQDFVRRFKIESNDEKGAPKVKRISGFMHIITNPELIKRFHDKIPKSVDEMMKITTSFLRGGGGGWFTLLSKSPKEILALEKGKFKTPPPMTTSVKKRNSNKFCEFHEEVRHNTDECMHLKRQIEELLKNEKLSHVIKEIKQNSGKDQPKTNKKGETSNKDNALVILMIQSWKRVARQRITQSFSPNLDISFPPLEEEEGTKGPMIIEAEIEGHFIHRMYVDGESASEILYEHCFNRLLPKIKNQMVLATAHLIGFSGEIIWPLGKISLLVKIGYDEHSTSAWMNFVIVTSLSPYNRIIGRPRVWKIQAVLSIAHGMLKFPVAGGILTLKSGKIIPIECVVVSRLEGQPSAAHQAIEERINVAINLKYPEQTIMTGSTLTKEGRNKLCDLLQRSIDVFAWKPADMTGVARHKAEHRLNIREGCPPVRRKRKGQAANRNQQYKKNLKNSLMWMCVDFKDLKKACPKDGYPLPEINWNVEYLYGFPFKYFIVEHPEEDSLDTPMEVEEELSKPWILFTDESSCVDGSRAGLILTNPEGAEFTYALRFRHDSVSGKGKDTHQWLQNVLNQTGTRSVVAKALRTEYYWPTMHKDARALIRACQDCQGIDIARPFLEGPGKVKFLIVAIDYFTKFGLPGEIIYYNGKQFQDNPFKDWCEKLCIHQRFASVKHPQANGLVERENRSFKEGIKARLDARNKNWVKEISHVLWEHRTMIKSSNGDTLFSLMYGTKVVIPAKIGMPTLRTARVDLVQNDEGSEINLDLLEERREQAAILEAKSKEKMEKYYNSKVRSTSFRPRDLVYRSNDASHAKEVGKPGPKWEGPYKVTEALGKGGYKLRDRDGKQLSRTWNVRNLKKCHVHEM